MNLTQIGFKPWFGMHKLCAALSLFVYLGTCAVEAQAASPAPLDLQDACSFAVLAGSSISNSGSTDITGDVGSLSQAGFVSVSLTGTNYFNDASTTAAQNDLLAAYNDGAGRLTTLTLATELGGTVQGAGVYHAGTFTITGALTLDGGGDNNAVFIFKTDTTLGTAVSSTVNVTNGAQAKNVFWVIGSSVTLGATSVFKGTILAYSDITLGSGVAVTGRLLALRDSVFDSDTIINTISCGAPAPSVVPTVIPEILQLRTSHNAFDPRREDLVLSGLSSKSGRMELEIYDLNGHRVRGLLSQESSPGSWTVVWDGRDDSGQWAASDVYLILLRVGTAQQLKKVAILRD